MGILNLTPDSFYPNARVTIDAVLERAIDLQAEGADIVDLGGESTRPYASFVESELEIKRVLPALKKITPHLSISISIDTSNANLMQLALANGANMINDVRALQLPGAIEVVAEHQCDVCLMHMQNDPSTMQINPHYADILTEVYAFLSERIEACLARGINLSNIIIDVGFGFGKTFENNLTLFRNLDYFNSLGCRMLVGLSRKGIIGNILQLPIEDRLYGSLGAQVLAYIKGADIIRVHDVLATAQALKVVAVLRG